MLRRILSVALLTAVSACAGAKKEAEEDAILRAVTFTGPVKFLDADAVEIEGRTYKLYGIQSLARDEAEIAEAKNGLKEALGESSVDCTFWYIPQKVGPYCDSYGEGTREEIATTLVRLGLAKVDRTQEVIWPRRTKKYLAAEAQARSVCRGFWRHHSDCR